VWNV